MKVILYTAGDPISHKKAGTELNGLKPGEYIITVKRKKHIRSIDQNSYYWAILTIIATDTGEYDRDRLHEICKQKFNGEMVTIPKQGSMLVGKTTSELDSLEFTRYIGLVKMWARDTWGIVIPERGDTDYAKWADISNNYEKTFHP